MADVAMAQLHIAISPITQSPITQSPMVTLLDGTGRTPRVGAPRGRVYKSGSSRDRRGRASFESHADPHRARGGAWRTSAAARAGSNRAAIRLAGHTPSEFSRTRRG